MDSRESIIVKGEQKQLTREEVEENLRLVDDLKFFLATAPANWQTNQIIRRYYLSTDEGFVSCIYWNNLYFVTGTDIVRCVVYRFEQFGRHIVDRKKFEEGVFSDLRSLKCGNDAILEPSKSPFLEFLYRNSCLRTQKKQKVFFWFSVPHDKLFTEALERDLKKEEDDQIATTESMREPSLSFRYDPSVSLETQLASYVKSQKGSSDTTEELETIPQFDSSTSAHSEPQTDMVLSTDPIDITQQTYFIKEENGTPVVTPGRLDDDFPLDYFPQPTENTNTLLDPSVFMQVPESYTHELLIDQTNAKTPYDKRFDRRVHGDDEQQHNHGGGVQEFKQGISEREDDDPFLLYPQEGGVPLYTPSQGYHPLPYPYPPHVHPSYYQCPPQITNGQFYDAQINGETIPYMTADVQGAGGAQYYGPPPGYYPPYPQGAGYYTEGDDGDYYEAGYLYPPLHGPQHGAQDEDDQLYDAFERTGSHQHQHQHQPQHQPQPQPQHQPQHHQHHAQSHTQKTMSPFGRVFPGFQAMVPQSARSMNGRFPRSATQVKFSSNVRESTPSGRVGKPSTLRQRKSTTKLNAKALERPVEPKSVEQSRCGSKDDDDDDDDGDDVKEDEIDIDKGGDETDEEREEKEEKEDDEYTTLPTPDSTVPEK